MEYFFESNEELQLKTLNENYIILLNQYYVVVEQVNILNEKITQLESQVYQSRNF